MAERKHGDTPGPLDKTIVVTAIAVIGWFVTDFIYSTRQYHAEYEKRLTRVEAGNIERDLDAKQLRREMEDFGEALKGLERHSVRRGP